MVAQIRGMVTNTQTQGAQEEVGYGLPVTPFHSDASQGDSQRKR